MNQVLDFFRKLFDTSDWPPRWHCGNWTGFHGWLYIISDLLIWSAYFAIPLVILKYISRKVNARFVRLYFLFAAFILACGATHLLDAITFWFPAYRLNALVRFVTGVVSWITVFSIIRILPEAMKLRSIDDLEREIAERKSAEERLQIANERLQEAQQLARLGHWQRDLGEEVVQWSDSVYQIFGLPLTEAITLERLMTLVHPEDRQRLKAVSETALKTGVYESFRYRITDGQGQVKTLQATGQVVYAGGKPVRLVGTVQDISGQVQIEEQLQISNKRLQEAQEIARVGHWEWDVAKDIITWSHGMYRIYNLAPGDQLNYEKIIRHIHPDDRQIVEDAVQHALTTGVYPSFKYRIKLPGQPVKTMFARGQAVKDETGQVVRLTGTVQDITEQQKAEDLLVEKTAQLEVTNSELQRFAYVASHDLQEPLRKIMTFSSMLQKHLNSGDERSSNFLGKIENAASRLQRLIDDILKFSSLRHAEAAFQKVKLDEVLNGVLLDLELKIAERKAQIITSDLPQVEGIPTQMGQLLQNLMNNALKFTKPNTLPRIHITGVQLTGAALRNRYPLYAGYLNNIPDALEKEFALISVADNGIGFEPEQEARIFDVFERLHGKNVYEGSGIGLAICKKIVENHHGFIHATGKPDVGATFHFIIPVVAEKVSQHQPA